MTIQNTVSSVIYKVVVPTLKIFMLSFLNSIKLITRNQQMHNLPFNNGSLQRQKQIQMQLILTSIHISCKLLLKMLKRYCQIMKNIKLQWILLEEKNDYVKSSKQMVNIRSFTRLITNLQTSNQILNNGNHLQKRSETIQPRMN